VRLEQLHQHGLDRLALIEDGLGAYLQSADVLQLHAVTLQQTMRYRQAQGIDILAVIAETHPRLAQTERVLAGRHAVERLQLRLIHVLGREVQLQRPNTDILRPHPDERQRTLIR